MIDLNVPSITCVSVLAPLTLKQEVVGSRLTLFTIFIINSVEFYRISFGKTRLLLLFKDKEMVSHVVTKLHAQSL